MKSLVLLSLSAIIALSSSVFAQVVPGRTGLMLSNPQAGNQRFFQQTRVNTQYTQSQCVGAYSNQRYYLSGDRDGDTLPDSYDPLYLKDNFAIVGNNNNTYRLALILPTFNNFVGTEVFYHTPISGSNALSLRANNQNYSLANNNARFRLSKVAPLNQRVRAVTSEPILLEIPASRNPQDAYAQVAYQIRYATYRDNLAPASNYQVFPVVNSGDFGPALTSWFLNNNFPHNGGYGPQWTSNYTQTFTPIATQGINRGPEQTHALECKNYYTSRCGNGYRDISGQQPTNGSQTLPYALAAGGGVNEQCDPGTPGVTSPYIPAGRPVGTTCSQTCTLVLPQVVQYVDPIIIKSQRNITRNTPSTGQYTTGVLSYSSGNQIEYRVIISNPSTTLSTYTGISLREQLPTGFVYATTTNPVTIVTGGVVTPTTVTYNTATHQSSAFQLAPGASVTFFIRGTLLTNSPTMRTNIANLYVGNIEIDDSDVSMNYNIPLTPALAITKHQRIRPGATNYIMSGSLPNGSAFVTTPLTGAVGDMIDYRLQITNTGAGTAYLSTIVDNAINATIPGLNCPVVAISNMYHIVGIPAITSSIYKVPNQAVWTFNPPLVLQTNHTVNIYFSCLITSARSSYTNHGSMTWSTGSNVVTTPSNTVVVNLPTSITLNKEIKTGGMANYAQYESSHNGALLVNSGDALSYRITITKTGAALPSVSIADIWPACFSANDASIDSVNISPSLLLTGYPLPQLAVPGPVTVTIILDGIVTPSGNCGIERNTALLSLPAGYPYTIFDPWGNQYGISTLAPIQDTADFQLAGYVPYTNLWLEKTVSPPYTSSHNHNLAVQVGLPFWFTLRFGNTGNVTATGVTITDTLPAGLTCTSYFINGHGPTLLSGSNFSYLYGSLLPGSTGEISFSCVVNPYVASGSVIINTGYLFYNTTNIFDTASVTVLHNPGFTILKTVNTGTIFSGQVLTYTIHFVNTGSQLNSYYIIDPLSSALTYVPNSATLNGLSRPPVQSGNTLFWGCNAGISGTNLNGTSVCPLPSGGSGTIVFQALVH